MSIWLAIGITIAVGVICFFIGLAIGSAGKESEKERADYAISKAEKYKDELNKMIY